MPKTDNPLGPGFEWRLRRALDRVQPPNSTPRYQSAPAVGTLRAALLRAAPVVAIGIAGLLLTAYATTGSPNPVTWTQNAASAITSITHAPEPSQTAEPSSASSAPVQEPVRRSSQPPSEHEKPEGTRDSEPARTTEPPELRDDSLGSESGGSSHHVDD